MKVPVPVVNTALDSGSSPVGVPRFESWPPHLSSTNSFIGQVDSPIQVLEDLVA